MFGNMMQHDAAHIMRFAGARVAARCSALQCVTVCCCSVLQCVAGWCGVYCIVFEDVAYHAYV